MPKKHARLFALVMLIAAAAVLYQAKQGSLGPVSSLKSGASAVNEAATGMTDYMGSVVRRIFRKQTDLEAARAEIDRLRAELMRTEEIRAEARRLQDLLELRDNTFGYVASARVIARGTDRWANTFLIDKGATQGIQKNMAVITPRGLVGKVQEAGRDSSVVLLIDDPRFGSAVRLQTTRTEAVLSGNGRGRCVIKYADIDTSVSSGEVVVTSGLDGLFPFGIPVGEVTGIAATGQDEFFQYIELKPYVNSRSVDEVIVIRR